MTNISYFLLVIIANHFITGIFKNKKDKFLKRARQMAVGYKWAFSNCMGVNHTLQMKVLLLPFSTWILIKIIWEVFQRSFRSTQLSFKLKELKCLLLKSLHIQNAELSWAKTFQKLFWTQSAWYFFSFGGRVGWRRIWEINTIHPIMKNLSITTF